MIKNLREENEIDTENKADIFGKKINETTIQHVLSQKEAIASAETNKHQVNHYKCYVGKGNNSMMVRNLFKNRFWWLFNDKEEADKCNFFWT